MKFIRKGTMDLQLKDKTALVTGASVGIGRGIAKALAAEGVKLAISARRADKLQEVADEIVAAGGHRPVIIESDLYPEDAAAKLTAAAIQGLGHVDILVNNAGGSRSFKDLHANL
jgi:3-oxoacyl-[acyl-carrier protein] reductase